MVRDGRRAARPSRLPPAPAPCEWCAMTGRPTRRRIIPQRGSPCPPGCGHKHTDGDRTSRLRDALGTAQYYIREFSRIIGRLTEEG